MTCRWVVLGFTSSRLYKHLVGNEDKNSENEQNINKANFETVYNFLARILLRQRKLDETKICCEKEEKLCKRR